MSPFSSTLVTTFAELLTISLMHFVWQGVLLALMLVLVVHLFKVRSAQSRYLLSVGSLLIMGMAPVLTAIWHQSLHSPQVALAAAVSPASDPVQADAGPTTASPDSAMERTQVPTAPKAGLEIYVLICWLAGVCVLSLRLAIGVAIGLWIRANVRPLSADLEQRVQMLGERLAMNTRKRVFECARVGQAVAIGFLRPIVLIPTSWLTQLDPQTIEAIIAHELAHIRRWDLWVNLVQRIIETLLFFHPAVWWLSDRIRVEREMCCDEIAADLFDRAMYARSLESVATISHRNLLLATSISGGRKMKLLNRIGYLLRIAPAETAGNWWTFGLIAVALPFVALIASSYSASAKPPTDKHKKNADSKAMDAIVIGVIQPKQVTLVDHYAGKIASHRRIQVRALEKGYIDEVSVKEGQQVKRGDSLFSIRPDMYQARLDAESAEAKIAQLEYNVAKEQHEEKVISAVEVAFREAKLAKAKAKVSLAEAELQFTMTKAPFDGIVDRLQGQTGSLVLEGEVVSTLSDSSIVWVYFNVPETRYLEYIADKRQKEDTKVQLTLANGATFDQPGRISSIETDFNSETGTICFRADFPNPSGVVRHGQSCTVKLSRPMMNAIVVPQKAAFTILGKRFVYVIDKEGVAQLREIAIQQELSDSYVVKSGLSAGEKIVVEGLKQIVNGDKLASEQEHHNKE